MPGKYRCLEKPNKGQKIAQVLAIIQENPDISFAELRELVVQRLGVRPSTAYDYIRRAREIAEPVDSSAQPAAQTTT